MNITDNSSIDITPIEFEKMVKCLFDAFEVIPENFEVLHNQKVEAIDGTYQIDVLINFRFLGLDFSIVVECKKHKSPIKRELVQVLVTKRDSIKAQKAVLVSTTGFQSGAIRYAKTQNVALLRIIDSNFVYETRSKFETKKISEENKEYFYHLIESIDDNSYKVKLLDSKSSKEFVKEFVLGN